MPMRGGLRGGIKMGEKLHLTFSFYLKYINIITKNRIFFFVCFCLNLFTVSFYVRYFKSGFSADVKKQIGALNSGDFKVSKNV